MLKGIDPIISPDLIKILMEMGHGDEIVIADGNFPSANYAKRLVRLDGHDIPRILEAILKLIPLDRYSDYQVALMQVVKGDTYVPEIWNKYSEIVNTFEPVNNNIINIDRFAFYEQAKNAYAVIATGESALYANIILKKGVVV